MYIKNIKLQNYRNYENLNGEDGLDFGKKTTLLIGKNGSGKTNMIHALKQSLSFIFSRNSRVPQRNFVANTIAGIKRFEPTDAMRMRDENGFQNMEGTWPVRIETSVGMDDQKSCHGGGA